MFFLPFIVLFTIWLTYELKKSTRLSQKKEEDFWNHENNANFARKKDISNLDYIKVPLEELPFCDSSDEDLMELQEKVIEISQTEILNLTGLSNTELKYKYGAANLDKLAVCDQNFTKLSRALYNWGSYLFQSQKQEEAQIVLEYAVACKVDVSGVYSILASIYHEKGETGKILSLKEQASSLNTLMKDSILRSLSSYLP